MRGELAKINPHNSLGLNITIRFAGTCQRIALIRYNPVLIETFIRTKVPDMRPRSRPIFLLLVIVSLSCTASSLATPRNVRRLATGSWGGPHIRIAVQGNNASVEFDCANGVIPAPLNLSRRGKFIWNGSFTRERGGPSGVMTGPTSGRPAISAG